MAKLYKQNMIDILTKLGISLPDHFEMDQMQAELLMGKIKVALDTYDPLPTGDAAVTDVLAGKTFSNATGTGLTGTCTFDADTSDATAVVTDITAGKTAYVDGTKVTGTYDFAVATAGTATAADIATGKTAWVAGVQITGEMYK
jgi:hypothetical protein